MRKDLKITSWLLELWVRQGLKQQRWRFS
jgi:hypothetical protein